MRSLYPHSLPPRTASSAPFESGLKLTHWLTVLWLEEQCHWLPYLPGTSQPPQPQEPIPYDYPSISDILSPVSSGSLENPD